MIPEEHLEPALEDLEENDLWLQPYWIIEKTAEEQGEES